MSLKAVIDSNAWAPYNAIVNGFDYQRQLDPEVTPGAPVNPWNGFLSLRKTQETVIPSNTTNEAYYNEHNRGNRTYYENGAFYAITHGLSNKMRQLRENPEAALAGEWFTTHGRGEDLGYFGRAENAELAARLRTAFAAWIDNGHNDFSDENTRILRIRLTDGVLFSHGTRYDLDFGA